jgi:hypothetical protein
MGEGVGSKLEGEKLGNVKGFKEEKDMKNVNKRGVKLISKS